MILYFYSNPRQLTDKTKSIITDKRDFFSILIKVSTHEEGIAIINVYVTKKSDAEDMK